MELISQWEDYPHMLSTPCTNATSKGGLWEISARDLVSFPKEPSSSFGQGPNSTMKSSLNTDGNTTTKLYKMSSKSVNKVVMSIMAWTLILSEAQGCLIKLWSGILTELMLKEKLKSIPWHWKSWIRCKSSIATKNYKLEPTANKTKCTYSKSGPSSEAKAAINITSETEPSGN